MATEQPKRCKNMEKKQEDVDKEPKTTDEQKKSSEEKGPPMMALNHVSRLCRDVKKSLEFYTKVVGFVLIERPQAFDFDGAWLFNYGVGIHLVHSEDEEKLPGETEDLNPMDNHISLQCEDMDAMERTLKKMNVKYMKRSVDSEDGASIDQLFFKDPDGHMIEICNCENLKLVPADSLGKIKLPFDRHNPPLDLENGEDRDCEEKRCP